MKTITAVVNYSVHVELEIPDDVNTDALSDSVIEIRNQLIDLADGILLDGGVTPDITECAIAAISDDV